MPYATTLRNLRRKDDEDVFIRYLVKNGIPVRTYGDYFKACLMLGIDLTLPPNRYPRDFAYWHDVRIDQYNSNRALLDKKQRQALYDRFASVADRYASLQYEKTDDFIVLIAKSPAELIAEGDALHHCIGKMNYDLKFVREESLIFFVRKSNDPNTPYVTLEYSPSKQKILQCRGYANSDPDNTVLDFIVNTWLPFANRQLKKTGY